MIIVLDPDDAEAKLVGAALACPSCARSLTPWGYARHRSVAGLAGRIAVRPRRARCRHCRTTHVLLPTQTLPRRSASVDVIGAALVASARGDGHRRIADMLGVPADTIRGWVRRVRTNSEWLRCRGTDVLCRFDPTPTPIMPASSALGDAIEALALAAAAITRRLGVLAPPWHLIAAFTAGQLLAEHHRSG